MSARLREVADRDAEALLVKALGERGGVATGADLEVATGLPQATVGQAMNRLLDRYESRLAVAKGGALVYRFDGGFRLRPERRAALRAFLAAAASVGAAVTTAARFAFQVVLAVQLLVYTFVATLPLAVVAGVVAGIGFFILAIFSDKDFASLLFDPYVAAIVLGLFMLGGIGWVIGKEYQAVMGVFRGKSGAGGGGRAQALFSVVRCVNDFAVGPDRRVRPEERTNRAVRISLAEERLVLARVRTAGGRLRSGDLVRWLGLDLDEADRQATRLAVEHDGTPEGTNLEVIEFHFPGLLDTAADGDPKGKTAFERGAVPPLHTGNGGLQDTVIAAFAFVNLGAGAAGLHYLGGHEGHAFLWRAGVLLGGQLPIFFSVFLLGFWLARWPATWLRGLLVARREVRRALIRRVVEHCRKHAAKPLALPELDADRQLAYALGGESDVDDRRERARIVWRFDRLAAELRPDGGAPKKLRPAEVVYET